MMPKGHTSPGRAESDRSRPPGTGNRSLIRTKSDLELLQNQSEPVTRVAAIGKQSVRCKNGHY
jgi:hypothetical protein